MNMRGGCINDGQQPQGHVTDMTENMTEISPLSYAEIGANLRIQAICDRHDREYTTKISR